MYGWYSAKQARACGTTIYLNKEGTEVVVTTVTETPDHGTKWDDIELKCEVTKFVRSKLEYKYVGMDEDGR